MADAEQLPVDRRPRLHQGLPARHRFGRAGRLPNPRDRAAERRPGEARLHLAIDQPLTETLLVIDLNERDGTTTLELVHEGWDDLGPAGRHLRERHEQGWGLLLEDALRPLVEKQER